MNYLDEAVDMAVDVLYGVTVPKTLTDIYIAIAHRHDVSVQKVETAIRHSVMKINEKSEIQFTPMLYIYYTALMIKTQRNLVNKT